MKRALLGILLLGLLMGIASADVTFTNFTSSGNFTVTSACMAIDVFEAGSGGSGYEAGGGGGYTLTTLGISGLLGDTWIVTINPGGTYPSPLNGGRTRIENTTVTLDAPGGIGASGDGKGGNGGSGGGGFGAPLGGHGGTNGAGGEAKNYAGGTGQGTTTTEFAEGGRKYSGGGGAMLEGAAGDDTAGAGGTQSPPLAGGDGVNGRGGGGGGGYSVGYDPGDGGTGFVSLRCTASAPSPPPGAAFHASPLVVWRNGTIQFTDDTTNTPTNWNWYDPDTANPLFTGNLTNQNPKVFPRNWGYHSVNLIACNGAGCNTKASGARYIYVIPPGVI